MNSVKYSYLTGAGQQFNITNKAKISYQLFLTYFEQSPAPVGNT